MKPLGRMHIILLLLAIINMIPVIEADASWSLFAIIVSAALVSCVYYKRFGDRRFPHRLIYIPVLVAIGYLLYEMFYPHEEAPVYILDLAHFIALLCCCKFFELHTHRDAGLIALIAFLLLVISAFVSASPFFGIVLVVDCTVGVGWIIAFHAQRERSGIAARRHAAMAGRTNRGQTTPDEHAGRPALRFMSSSAACSVTLFVVAGLVFVILPRELQGGLLRHIHGLLESSVTGFSSIVQLTNKAIREDDSPVLRARFFQNGRTLNDETFQPYLRGWTFDRYYEGRWRRTPRFSKRFDLTAGDQPILLIDADIDLASNGIMRQETWLENTIEGVLFSLYPPLAFQSPDLPEVKMDRLDQALQAPSRSRKKAHYTVYSTTTGSLATEGIPLRRPRSVRDGWSRIPPRVMEFARSFAARLGDPTDPQQQEFIAQAFRDYLASGLFDYTFDRGAPLGNKDPVADFLFDNRRGHCEYFASTMAVLCQSVGIMTRLVGGYHGGEYNPVGGFYQFRQKDAHSWVEVFLPDRGWVIFDPTPPSAIPLRRTGTSLLAQSRSLWDFVQFKWSTLVVTFDTTNRQDLTRNIHQWFTQIIHGPHRPRTFASTLKTLLWGPELLVFWQRLLYWLLLALCVAFVILLLRIGWILSILLRELLPARRGSHHRRTRRPEARFYDRLLLHLARKGYVKPAHSTPMEFARFLAGVHPDLSEMPILTGWYYDVQYGRHTMSEPRRRRIRSLLQRLREDPAFAIASSR